MSASKYKFVSPGVFLSEIDNSQLPGVPGGVGPVIIGRTRQGPAMKPVKITDFEQFVNVFGNPIPGTETDDPWRNGNGLAAPAYAPLAAQAYLSHGINSPVTVIRLLGVQGDDASDAGHAGWEAEQAFGIFAAPGVSGSHTAITASLIGVLYSEDDSLQVGVKGNLHGAVDSEVETYASSSGELSVKAIDVDHQHRFTILLKRGSAVEEKSVSLRPSDGENYIRSNLNTNPVATNTSIIDAVGLNKYYWLGETFEEAYEEVVRNLTGDTQEIIVFVSALDPQMADFKSTDHQLASATTGWVIPQYTGTSGSFDPESLEKLFRFHSIVEGELSLNVSVQISGITIAPEGAPSPYGTFNVSVYKKETPDSRPIEVESFSNLDLNPNSENFIARQIGDQYFRWDSQQKRNKAYGNYGKGSNFIRVELGGRLKQGQSPSNPKSVPFGFLGPVKPADRADNSLTTSTASFSADADWVTGSVIVPGAGKLRVSWPTAPHVTVGTLTAGGRVEPMGSTSYVRRLGTNIITNQVNPGMKDYLRKFSSFGAVVTDQVDGAANGTTVVHGYSFSLDEVVVTGATAPGDNLDRDQYIPTAVDFIAGSHAGTATVAAVNAATASAEISYNDAGEGLDLTALDGKGFTLRDIDGNAVPFVFSDAVSTADGSEVRDGAGRAVVIGILGAAIDVVQARIVTAINGLDGGASGGDFKRVLNITASELDAAATVDSTASFSIALSQSAGGASGNTAITVDAGGIQHFTFPTKFSGGITSVSATEARSGTAYTALSTGGGAIELLKVVDSFSMPFVGGCDGVDIKESDPFNMSTRTVSGKTTRTSYAYASIDRAIELMRDPEVLEANLVAMPGITNPTLTNKLIQTCEARADMLAIIDLPDVYIPPAEDKCDHEHDRTSRTTPEKSARELIKRQINSSYGCTYYPWVQVTDTTNGPNIWVPPSVVALGVMANTEDKNEVWFAPAGFNRGGLNSDNVGLPVLRPSEQLLSSQRDKLYAANINPIASFVNNGNVIFGQKTLQMTPSALDRINVRRLLIFVKKQVSFFASQLLFDQNLPATWNRFTGLVNPFLESVKTRLGLADFKVILDRSTTTPDLVDRNVMYAKIFLKPARAIEFIAVDFVITRSGASFENPF